MPVFKRCILLFFLPLALFAQQTPLYFPPLTGVQWENTSPSQLNFCPERIDSLYAFLDRTNTKSFILLQDGKIVLEKYYGAYTADSFWYWASAGKSLSAFLVGQAKDEGLLSLSDKTSKYLGQGWTTCPPQKEDLITVWHQITMTTGLNDLLPGSPDPGDCTDPACLAYKADAGTRWAYHNAPYHLVHNVLEKASGINLNQFTKTRLFNKVGMKGLWLNHVMYGRARDMARFGLLMLANGIWNGDTLLHDPQYVHAMVHPSQELNKSYGYLFWLNGQESYMIPSLQLVFNGPLASNAPADMYAALGKNDQKIHVVPSKRWVVVRQGESADVSPVPIVFDNQLWAYLNALNCSSAATEADDAYQSAWPNPTVDEWRVNLPGSAEKAELWDGFGRMIQGWDVDAQAELVVAATGLKPGVYLLNITGKSSRRTLRLLRSGD